VYKTLESQTGLQTNLYQVIVERITMKVRKRRCEKNHDES